MQQASHRVVHEEGGVCNLTLPFTLGWDVLAVGQNTLPAAARHNFSEFLLNKVPSLGL